MVVDADMRAWTTHGSGDARLTIVPVPEIAAHSLLVRVEACGVCRTDLHVIDGDIARHRDPVIPGHQVVGEVIATGSATSRFAVGDRVGVAWLAETCGSCRWCISGKENLCPNARFTGGTSMAGTQTR